MNYGSRPVFFFSLGRVYTVTPLSSRTFAIWTLLSACLRLYTAYDIQNKG